MIDQFPGHHHHHNHLNRQQQHKTAADDDDIHHDNSAPLRRTERCTSQAHQQRPFLPPPPPPPLPYYVGGPLELTDSGLRDNVQIVLNNLHRNAFYADTAASLAAARKRSYARRHTMLSSPESDCNSNPHPSGICGGGVGAVGSLLSCSIASSHDFTHDNSDYQWFLDYGYRDGVTHQSILSSLSASYNGIGELSYYEDLAKNIDANLAEVDMESFTFRQADNADRMAPLRAAVAAASRAQSRATVHDLDNSICTSKQLFSPVKETVTLSVDSLDLDGFGEGEDIILTCQANKDNYTIAFEGSTVYSEESYYGGLQQQQQHRLSGGGHYGRIDEIIRQKALEVSMSRSDTGFTTWSKLKKNSSQSQMLQRYPSGNNNTTSSSTHVAAVTRHAPHCFVRKSSSLPDLQAGTSAQRSPRHHNHHHQQRNHKQHEQLQPSQLLHVSQALSNSTVESYGSGAAHSKLRHMLPMFPMPTSSADGCSSGSESPAPLQRSTASSSGGQQLGDGAADGSSGSDNPQQQQQPAFNLVKLFIKQKSSSTDTCMDVSSGCWPSSESPSSSQEQQQQQQQQQRHRKKSMNDSGKGSALSRHDEDMESGDFQYDSLDVAATNSAVVPKTNRSNDLYREVFDSPSRGGTAAACGALNIKSAGGKLLANLNNNINNNNNNSMEKDSLKETNTSLTDDSRTSENITQVFAQANHIPAALMSRSIQTSMRLSQTTAAASSGSGTATRNSAELGHRVRVVPPSFLAQLSQNSSKLGESQPAPVYVIYPNYALPDLAFVNHSDVILSPLSYTKSGMSPPCSLNGTETNSATPAQQRRSAGAATGTSTSMHTPKRPTTAGAAVQRRPVSLLDCDALVRNKDYGHIADWQSLATLLPVEYRNLLRHIPAVSEAIQAAPSQRPLFSMSPPLRRSQALVTCDCAQYVQQNSADSASGSSGSDQRGSSGYRGSSTMLLTDSEAAADQAADPMRNMYVYQYENNTHMDQQQGSDRPPSGRGGGQPRGILRRMNSKTRTKRNSMFEEPTAAVGPAEKRHSLQEQQYYNEPNSIIEDYLAELDDDHHHHQHPTQQQQHRLNNSRVYTPNGGCSPAVAAAGDDPNGAKYNLNYIQELNEEQEAQRAQHNAAAANYYAEVATILHSIERTTELYDRHKLRSQVSRALSAQTGGVAAPLLTKKVSFDGAPTANAGGVASGAPAVTPTPMDTTITLPGETTMHRLAAAAPAVKEFSTPPNSPNISVAQLRLEQKQKRTADQEKQEKIKSNRFKRLQIQWELLSKEAQVLREELGGDETMHGGLGDDCVQETRSGGSTPTSAATLRSRIPRPVSYPATKPAISPTVTAKQLQSPSRMVAPKRYTSAPSNATGASVSGAGTTTPSRSRTPSKLNTTPKRTVPTPTRTSSARSTR